MARCDRPLLPARDAQEIKSLTAHFQNKAFELGTQKRYHAQLERFKRLCERQSIKVWQDHTIETSIVMLLNHVYEERLSINTFDQWVSAINSCLKRGGFSPLVTDDYGYQLLKKGLKKEFPREVKQARPFSMVDLKKVARYTPDSELEMSLQNLVIISFWGAYRAEEIVGTPVTFGQVRIFKAGLTITLKKRKWKLEKEIVTSMSAQSSLPCPVRAMKSQIDLVSAHGAQEGDAIFRDTSQSALSTIISVHTLMKFVNKVCGMLYLPGEKQFTSHSFRAGCITWLLAQGKAREVVMRHSGHASLASFLGYARFSAQDTQFAATNV